MSLFSTDWACNYDQIITYVPRFYRDVFEMDAILRTEGALADGIQAGIERALNNLFLATMDETALAAIEDYIGLTVDSASTLEERRRVVLAHFVGYGHISASLIKEMLQAYTDCDIDIIFTTYDPDGTLTAGASVLSGAAYLDGSALLDGEDTGRSASDLYIPGDNALYITIYRDGTQRCLISDIKNLLSIRLPAHIWYVIIDYLNSQLDMSEAETVELTHLKMDTYIQMYSADLLDGDILLDGSAQLNAVRYKCTPGLVYAEECEQIEEAVEATCIDMQCGLQGEGEEVSSDVAIAAGIDVFSLTYLDGEDSLDGSVTLDSVRTGYAGTLTISVPVGAYSGGIDGYVAQSYDLLYLDGSTKLTGIAIIDAIYEKEEF